MNPKIKWMTDSLISMELSDRDALYLIGVILTRSRLTGYIQAGQNMTVNPQIKRQLFRNKMTKANKGKTK